TIGRILNDVDLKPHHYRMWCHSPDAEFARKVREVVALYVNPPKPGEVVLCIDEKTGMQALSRRFRGRLPSPGEMGRWEFEYKRQGTRVLTAAYDVHTAYVLGRCTRQRRELDLLAFMDLVADRYPTETIHVVWDNLNTHHGERWIHFNRRHGGRFRFHYTPIHASLVNQVELWFLILTLRGLRRGNFCAVPALAQRVMAFIERWNTIEGQPFDWTYTGRPMQTGLHGQQERLR